ncbi:hypothetical protein MUY35_08425 [Aliiroseovarius sp. S1339]|uniref:hypothetical protein n=1 Tax=Aliiroseovarius sp. S1339 TaxID=2936990 RepID=UPI0020BD88A8|nr:hypothetical protein [Aliiroseovarius sp. S1339]MCK8463870.1 hypothetical protein [Aliiroseovarius sp. S1339]
MAQTDKDMLDDTALDAFFDAARSDIAAPSDALVSAILADAEAHQPQCGSHAGTAVDPGASRGFWADLVAAVGGWPSLAGMATATVAGVWIGFAAPIQLETMSGGLILTGDYTLADESYALEDLAPSYLGTSLLLEDEG